MPDPLDSSKYSLSHAKRHIGNLEREIAIFVKSNPYATVTETNADATEDVHKVIITQPMPEALAGIAFDAIVSLRSCLDQAGYAVALAAGKDTSKAKFPFGDSLTEVQGRIKGTSKHIPKEIFDLMVSFQPYKGGNNLLWALNKLCNSHKHEIIVPIAISTGHSIAHKVYCDAISFSFPPMWDRTKNEMIIAHLRHGTPFEINLQIQIFIALAKVDVVDGQPVIRVLNAFHGIVNRIIMTIESEAYRLNLFK